MPPDPQQTQPPYNPSPTPAAEPYVMRPTTTPGLTCGTPSPVVQVAQGPTTIPSFTPTSTSIPKPTNPPLTVPTVMKGAEIVKDAGGVVVPAVERYAKPPFDPITPILDFSFQMYKDTTNGISVPPAIARSAAVSVENIATGGLAFAGGVSAFAATSATIGGLPVSIPAGILAGAAVTSGMNNVWSGVNENFVFPYIQNKYGN